MRLDGQHRFRVAQDAVYAALLDPALLKRCMPGCERLEEIGPGVFEAVMKMGVPGLKGTFGGKVAIRDSEPPHAFTMVVEGSGPTGFVKGEGRIALSAEGGTTHVSWSGDVQVGGLVAGIGQRVLGGVARMLTAQFFKTMETELGGQPGHTGSP